jgi:hypothetical protein
VAVEVSTAFGNAVVLRLGLLSLEWGDSVIFPVLRENAVFLRICDSERFAGERVRWIASGLTATYGRGRGFSPRYRCNSYTFLPGWANPR